MAKTTSHVNEFAKALKQNAQRYGISLNEYAFEQLSAYYELVRNWNERLHLVAPCSPAEFATRHVLESLVALPYLTPRAGVVDIGSGAGLPIIPCLVARPDLSATLFEASQKKAIFLREALQAVGARGRAVVLAQRFEHRSTPRADFITCRALDRFSKMLPDLYGWSPPGSTLLLFGGQALRQQLEKSTLAFNAMLIPQSEQRFLFIVKKQSKV